VSLMLANHRPSSVIQARGLSGCSLSRPRNEDDSAVKCPVRLSSMRSVGLFERHDHDPVSVT
jgi:hypothetical protein